MKQSILAQFDRVRIINLVDRTDRRREISDQVHRAGGFAPNISFFDAQRPNEQGPFPTLGARGCFESQLSVLRSARAARVENLCLLEDDIDFTRAGLTQGPEIITSLLSTDWDIFYGAHLMAANGRAGLTQIASEEAVVTASFVAFNGRILEQVVEFLEGMLKRPAGSPDYGPMHVDGAYTVFRLSHPLCRTFAAFPSLGRQRSSMSDITPRPTLLDRHAGARPLARILRRGYNALKRL